MNTLTEDESKLIARLIKTTPDMWRVTESGAFTCDQDVYALNQKQYIEDFDARPSNRQGENLKKSGYLFFDSKEGAMQFNNAVSLMAEKCGAASDRMNERNQHERLWDAEKGEQVIPKLDNHVSTELLNLAPLVVGKTNLLSKEQQDLKDTLEELFKAHNPLVFETSRTGYWTEADMMKETHSSGLVIVPSDEVNLDEEEYEIPEKYCVLKQLKQYSDIVVYPDPTPSDWDCSDDLNKRYWGYGTTQSPHDMTFSIELTDQLNENLNIATYDFRILDTFRYDNIREALEHYWDAHEMYNEKGEHVYKMDGKDYKTNAQGYWATPEIKKKAWYMEWLTDLNRARSDAKVFMKAARETLGDEEYEFEYKDYFDEEHCEGQYIRVIVKRKAPEMPYHALALFPKMAREIESCHEMLRTLLTHAQATNDEVALQHLAPFDMATMEEE